MSTSGDQLCISGSLNLDEEAPLDVHCVLRLRASNQFDSVQGLKFPGVDSITHSRDTMMQIHRFHDVTANEGDLG